ncbi:MAG: leucyl aminopeptidase [Bacteroidetes bacterium]|nr:leucyl aminopeptidase [Bacteroidota bacterium]
MKLTVTSVEIKNIKANALVLFLPKINSSKIDYFQDLPLFLKKKIELLKSSKQLPEKSNEILSLFTFDESKFEKLIIVGLGETKNINSEIIRRAASLAAKTAQDFKSIKLAFYLNKQLLSSDTQLNFVSKISQSITEGVMLGTYNYNKYKTSKKKASIQETIFKVDKKFQNEVLIGSQIGRKISSATILARDLANAPGNEIYPETLAQAIQNSAKLYNFSATILKKDQIEKLGMGGIIAVSKGSSKPPFFAILEYGKDFIKSGTTVLVGKGVTFDSGGISIKPSASMSEMKMDMSGAAAVIGTFKSIATLKLKTHVVGLIPMVENMPGGNSLKPGDIIRHHNKKTSEVDNTDAEGRLILADSLSYASKYKPKVVIDLATLTGACVVALGHHATGMMGNDQNTMNELSKAGDETYERVWQLPFYEEYESQIKSDVADVKNVGGRWAGAITAGLFLKKFIGKYNWVHLDIAGTAILEEKSYYSPKGGSGVGVRLLTEYLMNKNK